MTEQIVDGVFSAEVDTESHRIVHTGTLGETSVVPFKPVKVTWKASGPVRLIAGHVMLVDRLRDLYEFKGAPDVERFLETHLWLNDLLLEAREVIRTYFGDDVEVALEVVADPEALGDEQLFVLIRTDLPRQEARARLAELDQEWWLDALPATEGKMEIALE